MLSCASFFLLQVSFTINRTHAALIYRQSESLLYKNLHELVSKFDEINLRNFLVYKFLEPYRTSVHMPLTRGKTTPRAFIRNKCTVAVAARITVIHSESENMTHTTLLSISSPTINRFQKLFH